MSSKCSKCNRKNKKIKRIKKMLQEMTKRNNNHEQHHMMKKINENGHPNDNAIKTIKHLEKQLEVLRILNQNYANRIITLQQENNFFRNANVITSNIH